jgi:hypothetical protein
VLLARRTSLQILGTSSQGHGPQRPASASRTTLWSLIRVRPEMIRDTSVADELQAKLERLLDENLVSAAARKELDALRYGIAMAQRY